MSSVKDQLLSALSSHSVVVVSGETGSGKTTQVPQYILEHAEDAAAEAPASPSPSSSSSSSSSLSSSGVPGVVRNGGGSDGGGGGGGCCNIVCTQPRRIAAVSVAERVAVERCEGAPGSKGGSVGFHVRLDAARNADTRLLFCTTGILLRRLTTDPTLLDVSHVVVDEVHERSVQSDFLLAILRDILHRRSSLPGTPPLKLVLMSATLDASLFSAYFGGCPVISAQGRTFPVQVKYLEDVYETTGYALASESPAALRQDGGSIHAKHKFKASGEKQQQLVKSGWGDETLLQEASQNPHYDPAQYEAYSASVRSNLRRLNEDVIDFELIEDLVAYVDEQKGEGGILVFLPGIGEIQLLYERLIATKRFGSEQRRQWVVPLHSSVSNSEQQMVFQRPPQGIRKVILATNIAETSITVEDIVYVIDTGKQRETRYDPHKGMSSLVETWVSRANARQRAGRAGRVREGLCFSLYTKEHFEGRLRAYQQPEIQRVPLLELCLQIKLMHLGTPAAFLAKVIEPPRQESVTSAVASLIQIGALDAKENLTPLGAQLAMLPVDVRLGKMLILGCAFGCLSTVLTVAACLSHKSPFSTSFHDRDAVRLAQLAVAAKEEKTNPSSISSSSSSSSSISSTHTKDTKDTKVTKSTKVTRDTKETKETRSTKDTKDTKCTSSGSTQTLSSALDQPPPPPSSSPSPFPSPSPTPSPSPFPSPSLSPSPSQSHWNFARGQQSDHLVWAAVYQGWTSSMQLMGGSVKAREFCKRHCLSVSVLLMLRDMRRQFAHLLADAHLIPPPSKRDSPSSRIRGGGGGGGGEGDEWYDASSLWCNASSGSASVVKAVLCASLASNVAVLAPESLSLGQAGPHSKGHLGKGGRPKWTAGVGKGEVAIHPSSVDHSLLHFQWPFIVYLEKVKTSKVFMRDCSVLSPSTVLLFGSQQLLVKHEEGKVVMDGLTVVAAAQTAVLLKELRLLLRHTMTSSSDLQSQIPQPLQKRLIQVVTRIMDLENQTV